LLKELLIGWDYASRSIRQSLQRQLETPWIPESMIFRTYP
jgi:hypothetical protein